MAHVPARFPGSKRIGMHDKSEKISATDSVRRLIVEWADHGSVRRDGRWTLPHRLVLRTAWCDVMLDLTSAVRNGSELVIEMRVRGGNVELVLAPGMVVDANEPPVRFTTLAISRDAGDDTPETLRVRLAGRMKHARIDTRWLALPPMT
jgi:hypothetical protein